MNTVAHCIRNSGRLVSMKSLFPDLPQPSLARVRHGGLAGNSGPERIVYESLQEFEHPSGPASGILNKHGLEM